MNETKMNKSSSIADNDRAMLHVKVSLWSIL